MLFLVTTTGTLIDVADRHSLNVTPVSIPILMISLDRHITTVHHHHQVVPLTQVQVIFGPV
jgi:hypothetical protein